MTTILVQTENMVQPAPWVSIPDSGAQSESDACSAPPMTVHGQLKSLPPKCASVPGLIPSSTHSPRVVYRTVNRAQLSPSGNRSNIRTSSSSSSSSSSNSPGISTTNTRNSKALLKSQSMSGKMTARKPLRSSPLAGPPALFETESDSDSGENEDTPSAPLPLSWNDSPMTSHVDPISPSHPDFVFDSGSVTPSAAVSSSISASSRIARVLRPPRPPPECHLHPRADNGNDVVTGGPNSSNWYPTLGVVGPKYKCTCRPNAKDHASDGVSKRTKNRHSVLKKKRFSAGVLTSTLSFHATPAAVSRNPSPEPSHHTADTTSSAHYHKMTKPLPNPPMSPSAEVQFFEKKATETAPPPRSRSVLSGSGKAESLIQGREPGEAGGGGWGGGLRDYVDGDARGAGGGADVSFDAGAAGATGMGDVSEGVAPLAWSIIPGELGRRRTETSEQASGSEGRGSGVVSPVSVHVVVEGESRRRRNEWETIFRDGGARSDNKRRMTMADFGIGDRKAGAVDAQEDFRAELDVGEEVDCNGSTRRRSIGNPLDVLSHGKSTQVVDVLNGSTTAGPPTPPHKRLSMSTSSPLASPSPTIAPRPSATPVPKTKRPAQTDNSWYTANPYGDTPKFTRLGLSASNVVMPVSAKDRLREKKGKSTAIAHDSCHATYNKKRWSNFPSSSSCTLPSTSTPTDEGSAKSSTSYTSETEVESETLSRSSSASATTSASSGSAYWSACTTTTMTSPSSTSEGGNYSLERVESIDLGECMLRPSLEDGDRQLGVKVDTVTSATVKQTDYGHKSHRRSLAIMKGALCLRAGSIHSPQPQPRLDSRPHDGDFKSSELALRIVDTEVGGGCGINAMSTSQNLVYDQQRKIVPVGVDYTSSTPTLGRHSSLYSLTHGGRHGGSVEGMCEGKKPKGGDSSVKRWWKALVGGGR